MVDRPAGSTTDDAVEVMGLSNLLHPDSHAGKLELIVRCRAHRYAATIEQVANGWALLLEDRQGAGQSTALDATRDASIVSALLAALDTSWLCERGED